MSADYTDEIFSPIDDITAIRNTNHHRPYWQRYLDIMADFVRKGLGHYAPNPLLA